MRLQNVLFKQSANDYMQCAVSCVRSMNIYDFVFLFRKETGKINQKLIKMFTCGRMRGKGWKGQQIPLSIPFCNFDFWTIEMFHVFKKRKCKENENSKPLCWVQTETRNLDVHQIEKSHKNQVNFEFISGMHSKNKKIKGSKELFNLM